MKNSDSGCLTSLIFYVGAGHQSEGWKRAIAVWTQIDEKDFKIG